jgi:hypothetical protein
MRTLIITSFLLLVAPACSFATDTNQFTLLSSLTIEWSISESRVLATPKWIPGESIPLPPDKAWRIARDWFQAHGFSKPRLVTMSIQGISSLKTGDIPDRFYYLIWYSSPKPSMDSKVVILMDGTVLEPHQIAKPSTHN